MLIINFEGREAKGLSKGRYDKTFAGEDAVVHNIVQILLYILYMTELAPIHVFLVIVHAFLSSADFSSKYYKILSNIILCIPMSNSLHLDQARIFVKPDLGPNC